jgi:hypothetical protein
MALVPPVVTDWVTNSGTSNHTTSDASNFDLCLPSSY